jgi:hypothetical protein
MLLVKRLCNDRRRELQFLLQPAPGDNGREHAIKLLDALNAPEFEPWTLRGRRSVRTASRQKTKRWNCQSE